MKAEANLALERRAVLYFLLLTFGSTWFLWSTLWILKIGPEQSLRFAVFGTAGMYLPGASALIVRRFALGERLHDTTLFRIGRAKFYWLAWILFPALIAATVLIELSVGLAHLDRRFIQLLGMFVAAGKTPPSDLRRFAIGQLVTALIVGPPLHAFATVGEELGWRDFLLPRLIRSGFGQWFALITTGAIWGLWHVPVILLGFEYTAHPFLGIPAFVAYAVLAGIILGWLQLASGSVWVPAIAHGSINAVQRAALVFITGYDGVISGGLGSLIGWMPMCACVAWLAATHRIPVRIESETMLS